MKEMSKSLKQACCEDGTYSVRVLDVEIYCREEQETITYYIDSE